MTRHSIKSDLTRLVVIVSIATSIGVGSVWVGGTAEVAARPVDCGRLIAASDFHWAEYRFWSSSNTQFGRDVAARELRIFSRYFFQAIDAGCY
jgi:hypothetical protein